MAKAVIKAEHLNLQIGFNNSGVPLGLRDDIDELAKIAIQSDDAYLKSLFEKLPTEEELKEGAGEEFLSKFSAEAKASKKGTDEKK